MVDSPAKLDLLAALSTLELLTPGQTQALLAEPRRSANELLEVLVARGWLTAYQEQRVRADEMTALILGPYRLLEPLGEGGMGQVYKARHPFMNRLVTLKLIRPERLTHPEAIARFHQEIQAAAQLAHPNIVRAYDAAQAANLHYLAMELVDGIDLARVSQQRGPLPVAEACDYIRQAALGLQHAHEAGLVHRDLKPANLLLARDGTVKILDFGLARLATTTLDPREASELPVDLRASSLTQTGAMMGTPDYMAPEQTFDSHQVDIRADLYSLGCTLYQFLVTKPPFHTHRTLAAKIQAHRQYPPDERLEQVRPDVPPGLAMVVQALLVKNPAQRIGTPAQLAQALAPYCPGQRAIWQPPIPVVAPVSVAAPPSTVDVLPEGDTPLPGPTQPLPVSPPAPLPFAPAYAPPVPRIEDKLAWLEQSHGAEEELRRAQEISMLQSLMHQHLETAAWFPAYDTARALLKLEPTHEEAAKVADHLAKKLRRPLMLRVVARQAYQLFMGVGVGGMIILPAVGMAWLAQWVQDGWQGWGAVLLAFTLRVCTGGWIGGLTAVGLTGAVAQNLSDQRTKLEKQITEALAIAGFVIGIGTWCFLPDPFSGWALGSAYALLILACAIAPGGSPFVEQLKENLPTTPPAK